METVKARDEVCITIDTGFVGEAKIMRIALSKDPIQLFETLEMEYF